MRLGIDPALAYPAITPTIPTVPIHPRPAPVGIRVVPLPGTIALTFDDGPDPEWTPRILDILAEHDAKATFFALGWKIDRYPEIARRIVADGHSLQSHAYRHHNLTARSSGSVAYQIDETSRAIFEATGTTPVCLRPPGGAVSGRVRRIAADHSHEVVLWSQRGNTGDYAHGSASIVLRRSQVWEPGDVTLMHDNWGWIYDRALDAMLDGLESRGIGFSTICVPTEPAAVPPAD